MDHIEVVVFVVLDAYMFLFLLGTVILSLLGSFLPDDEDHIDYVFNQFIILKFWQSGC